MLDMPDKLSNQRSLKIFIAEYVPTLNKGELAILLGILQTFKILGVKTEVYIFSFFPSIDEKRYPYEVIPINVLKELKISNPLLAKRRLIRFKIFLLSAVQHTLFMVGYALLGRRVLKIWNKSLWQIYLNTDVFIIGHDQVDIVYGFGLMFLPIYISVLGRMLKKLIMIYANGINTPSNVFKKILTTFVTSLVHVITVRDPESYAVYRRLVGNEGKLFLTYDPAVLAPLANDWKIDEIISVEGLPYSKQHDSFIIGVDLSFEVLAKAYEGKFPLKESFWKAVEEVAKALDKFIEEFNAYVVFIPHCIEPYDLRDDRLVAKAIYSLMSRKDRAKVIIREYSTEELKGLISRFNLLVTSRVHAAVGAISVHVPVCVLAYPSDRRAYGLLSPVSQEKFIFDVRDLSSEKLYSHLKELVRESDNIKDDLRILSSNLHRKALVNGILLKMLLRGNYERK